MGKKAASTELPSKAEMSREVFAREYVIDHNAGRAAIAAGFAKTGARQRGYDLLQEPAVQRRIAELTRKLLAKHDITADRVMLELARIGFSDVRSMFDESGELLPTHKLDDDAAAAIAGLEVDTATVGEGAAKVTTRTTKVRRSDKVQALGLLARHFKLVGNEIDETIGAAMMVADRMEKASARLARMRKATR